MLGMPPLTVRVCEHLVIQEETCRAAYYRGPDSVWMLLKWVVEMGSGA